MASSTPPPPPSAPYKPRFIDIGINLTDPVYSGIHHGTPRHPSDLPAVLARARDAGLTHLLLTGSDIPTSHAALDLCAEHPTLLSCTIGVHPCSTQTFDTNPLGPQGLLDELRELILSAPKEAFVAIGEIGLDYDRLTLSPKETQLTYFRTQLDLAASLPSPPPLFLHSRAAHEDFLHELMLRADKLPKRGVVHSFTGTVSEMLELVAAGWDIGINGCSIRAAEGIHVVRALPLQRLHVETDGPWCEMRPTHASAAFVGPSYDGPGKDDEVAKDVLEREAGYRWVKKEKWTEGALVKGRNEPCLIGRIVVAVARIKGVTVEEVAEMAWGNSRRMFGFREVE
ncbi:hypothetical protein VC83_03939 [Pseudogymnoascus destructans]|uniref:TatD DNase n=2 Tax=Pseudogymnoascus destructans TaxID=655981 RepID=L8FMY1_PSED2|nr:uncharacterized protein VC83_03939 [Pseudogymnoascus destructans]ELR01899.1 hypothetical protein GMDG_05081 [Pseudogymnoascus destructans 20631-21]OAF59500.1 hypothetical protein VC83_03939 [Pseudogymnoascus destructans]